MLNKIIKIVKHMLIFTNKSNYQVKVNLKKKKHILFNKNIKISLCKVFCTI